MDDGKPSAAIYAYPASRQCGSPSVDHWIVSCFFEYQADRARIAEATYFGKISYGLYVYHVLVITLFFGKRDPWSLFFETHFLVADVSALLIAAISYHLFEQPILQLKAKFEVVKTGPSKSQKPRPGPPQSIRPAA